MYRCDMDIVQIANFFPDKITGGDLKKRKKKTPEKQNFKHVKLWRNMSLSKYLCFPLAQIANINILLLCKSFKLVTIF